MFQDPLIRFLLVPVALLYGLGVSIRNLLYRNNLLIGVSFNLPVISIGNLSIGGAGKSPHIEYLIRLLRNHLELAVLSRGYRRKTRDFKLATSGDTVYDIGDEPLMMMRKFPDVLFAVSESRVLGIPQILKSNPETQLILLDDGFQHLSVKPGLNILLTDYRRPYTRDFLLPSGRLREWRSASHRADIIIVTKCPAELPLEERIELVKELRPFPLQKVYFSTYLYGKPYYIFNTRYTVDLEEDMGVLLICAIANTEYLLTYLNEKVRIVNVMEFEDHHYFEENELEDLNAKFMTLGTSKKVIITTEKDAVRLELHRQWLLEKQLPLVVLPVEVNFIQDDGNKFDFQVKQFLLDFKV